MTNTEETTMGCSMDEMNDSYTSTLKAYLNGSGEVGLLHAYELGRRALAQGIGIIDMAEQHYRAMKEILLDIPQNGIPQAVRQATMFYEESLAPFEITYRSFKDATETSQRLIRLSSMAVHELKTSITSVLASAGMLEELLHVEQCDPIYRLLANLLKGASILKLHTDDLMNIVGFYVGAIQIRVQPFDMTAFLHQVYEYLQPEVIQHHLMFHLNVAPDLPLFEGDPDRLQQVLANLVQNAVKHAEERSSIELAGRTERDCLVIEVRDDGKGVSVDEQACIFQLYRRMSHNSQQISGLGIGLALCQQIIEAHNGTIALIIQPGEGSVFQIRLPLSEKWLEG